MKKQDKLKIFQLAAAHVVMAALHFAKRSKTSKSILMYKIDHNLVPNSLSSITSLLLYFQCYHI